MNSFFISLALALTFAVSAWSMPVLRGSNSTVIVGSNSVCSCRSGCPTSGRNVIAVCGGSVRGTYMYSTNSDKIPRVTSASVIIDKSCLDTGSETVSCTQDYNHNMNDDPNEQTDAGHILAHRLGGPGDNPTNIFPQWSHINRGSWEAFERDIYACVNDGAEASISWDFSYPSSSATKPSKATYSVRYSKGSCSSASQSFEN